MDQNLSFIVELYVIRGFKVFYNRRTEIFNKEIGGENPGIMHGLHSW
jgi:hypothetical protein